MKGKISIILFATVIILFIWVGTASGQTRENYQSQADYYMNQANAYYNNAQYCAAQYANSYTNYFCALFWGFWGWANYFLNQCYYYYNSYYQNYNQYQIALNLAQTYQQMAQNTNSNGTETSSGSGGCQTGTGNTGAPEDTPTRTPVQGSDVAQNSRVGSENSLSSNSSVTIEVEGKKVTLDISNNKWKATYPEQKVQQSSNTIAILDPGSSAFKNLVYNDTMLKGLVYTWGDLYAPDLQASSLTIRGGVVTFGGNPATDDPGSNGKGRIILNNGRNITFTYDAEYMHMLLDSLYGVKTKRMFHASF